MEKGYLKNLILRVIADREISGYEIWKLLSMKGIKVRTNYLYMVLTEMNRKELIKGRWTGNPTGPRKHLYSLGNKGLDQLKSQLVESVKVAMDAFIRANLTETNVHLHVASVRNFFKALGIPLPEYGQRLVLASPSFDPLICYPLSFKAFAEAFPFTSIFAVKPQGITLHLEEPNLVFLDGRRNDIPLRDDFADYFILEGFPSDATEDETLSECIRITKSEGYLIIRLPVVMTDEKRPAFSNFAEFVSKLFYDFSNQDKVVSLKRVREFLARCSNDVKEFSDRGNIVICSRVLKDSSKKQESFHQNGKVAQMESFAETGSERRN